MHVSKKIASVAVAGCLAVSMTPSVALAEEAETEVNDPVEVVESVDASVDAVESQTDVEQVEDTAPEVDETQTEDAVDEEVAEETDEITSEAADVVEEAFVEEEQEANSDDAEEAVEQVESDAADASSAEAVNSEDQSGLAPQADEEEVETGSIEITYVCHDTGKPLPGAVFEVVDAETGEFLGRDVSDANGKVVFTGIPYSREVQVNEISSPDGYETISHEAMTVVEFDKNGQWIDNCHPMRDNGNKADIESTAKDPLVVTEADINNNNGRYEFYFGARAVKYPHVSIKQLGQRLVYWLDIYEDELLENKIEEINLGQFEAGHVFENSGIIYLGPTDTHDLFRLAATKPCFIVANLVCKSQDQKPGGPFPMPYTLNYEIQLEHAHDGVFQLRYVGLTKKEIEDFIEEHPEVDNVIPEGDDDNTGGNEGTDNGNDTGNDEGTDAGDNEGADTGDDSGNGINPGSGSNDATDESNDPADSVDDEGTNEAESVGEFDPEGADNQEDVNGVTEESAASQNAEYVQQGGVADSSPKTADSGILASLYASIIAALGAFGAVSAYRKKRD